MFVLLLIGMCTLTSRIQPVKAGTIIVPDDYATIQAAIDNATDGDTIYVRNGIYYEQIVVDKRVTIVGENPSGTVVDGQHRGGSVITLEANRTTIANLTVQGSGSTSFDAGILIESCENRIEDNTITRNYEGIMSSIWDGKPPPGWLSENVILNNKITLNGEGFDLSGSFDQVVSNDITNNGYGGECGYWYNSTLSGNNITNSKAYSYIYGLGLALSDNNTVENNKISSDTIGILCAASRNNLFFHNSFLSNSKNADDDGVNKWDNGYPSGGNYWSDYGGIDLHSGPYQNETGSDGIGDTPYVIRSVMGVNNFDDYPLKQPYAADIAVLNVKTSKIIVSKGYDLNVTVTVVNNADTNETFAVTVYANGTAIAPFQAIADLTPNTKANLTFRWDTKNWNIGNYTVYAYASPVPEETNMYNNNCTGGNVWITFLGDINNDGVVNMKDVGEAVLAFNSFLDTPRWNPFADVDGDGRVDLKDINMIVLNFNKHE